MRLRGQNKTAGRLLRVSSGDAKGVPRTWSFSMVVMSYAGVMIACFPSTETSRLASLLLFFPIAFSTAYCSYVDYCIHCSTHWSWLFLGWELSFLSPMGIASNADKKT